MIFIKKNKLLGFEMKRKLLFFMLILCSLKIFSYNTIFEWRYLNDGRFTVYYPEGQYLYAKYAMNSLKEYSSQIDNITGNHRNQKLNIVLEDTGEFHNGSANPIENRLKLFMNTPNTHGNLNSQEWLNMLVIHEYTHQSHLTNAKNFPLQCSNIFGNVFSPNLYSPMWIVEGITVRNESSFSPYMGRLNNGYYTEIINAQMRDDMFQDHIIANYPIEDFPLGNYYVYGGAFIQWLADQYGEEKLAKFFDAYGSKFRNILIGSFFPKYSLDKAAKRSFNKSFPQLFTQWKNYIAMSADFTKDTKTVNIKHDWKNTILVSNLTTDNRNNLYFFETKHYFNHYRKNIIKYNVNSESNKIIYTSNSSLSANLEIKEHTLYFSEAEGDFTGNNLANFGYSGTSVLKKIDLDNNSLISTIFKKSFKDFTVAENGVIYYTCEDINSMTSSLFKYSNNHHTLIKNYPFLISELVYSDNKIYCTYKYPNSSWDIGEISLLDSTFSPVIKTYSQEKNISIDNNMLIFTSNQSNKSQAYSIDLSNKEIKKISNNFYADMPNIVQNKLYYKSISGKGERVSEARLVELPAKLNLVEDSRLITLIDDDYEEEHAIGESLSQMLVPYVRQPFGILSSDGIGFFDLAANWFIDSKGKGNLQANISTKLFSPLLLNYNLTNQDYDYLSAQLRIYNSQVNWLNSADLLGQTNFNDSKLLGNQLLFKKYNSSLLNYYMYDLNSRGYKNNLVLTHYFKDITLRADIERVSDYDEDPIFAEKDIKSGITSYNEYGIEADFNIYKVRKGFWTPNIAMKDIDLSLGIYQNNYKSSSQITYGKISTKTDIFSANVLNFNLEVGAYFNSENITPVLEIGMGY